MFKRTNITILTLVIILMSLTQNSYGAARPEDNTQETEVSDTSETPDTPDTPDTIIKTKSPDQDSPESKSSFIEDHLQLINIVRSLLHVPYIVTIDSQDPQKIRACALLSACATDSQLLYELLRTRNNTNLLADIVWHLPKAAGYAAGAVYEYGRFVKALEVAEKNKVFNKQLRNLKIQQTIQLVLELCLRGLVYNVSRNHPNQKETLKSIAEIADIIEVWRLLGRYNTFLIADEQQQQPAQTTAGEVNISK